MAVPIERGVLLLYKMEYIYNRCSTEGQDFLQQKNCIENYLNRLNKNIDNIQAIVEKVSGTVKHTERKLQDLLNMCKDGDTIYVSELSRLGRNMSDLFAIVTEASEKGITLVQCKDGSIIENNSIGGKALLFALSLAAEIEVQNIRQRTKMGLEARKKQLKEQGYFVNKKGEKITDWNAQYGKNTGTTRAVACRVANTASCKAKKEAAKSNENNKRFWQFVKTLEKMYGRAYKAKDAQVFVDELNRNNIKTATGMEYDVPRFRAMYAKCKKLFA